MIFTALAIFTPVSPSQSVVGVRYLCVVEKGPAGHAFRLRVLDPQHQNREVSSVVLKCHASALAGEARACVQELHPTWEFTLAPFEPWNEWQKLTA